MHWRIPLVVALVTLVAASCDQQPVEPSQEVEAAAPTFDFMNGPASAGPFVVRYGSEAGFFPGDEKQNLLATIGFDAVEFCNEIYDFDPMDWQEVSDLRDPTVVHMLAKGRGMRAALWEGISALDCEFILEHTPVLQGTVDLDFRDSNVWMASGRPESVTFTWHGTFSGNFHCVLETAPPFDYWCKGHINAH